MEYSVDVCASCLGLIFAGSNPPVKILWDYFLGFDRSVRVRVRKMGPIEAPLDNASSGLWSQTPLLLRLKPPT